MKPSVYIETSVFSYLAGKASKDVIVAAHQRLTADWWKLRRSQFRIFISEIVTDEASDGDKNAIARRLKLMEGLPAVAVTSVAKELANALLRRRIVPAKAATDALHISVAAASGMNYLLTWNCKHIANAQIRSQIDELVRGQGFMPPVLCTPEELMGVDQ